MSEKIKNEIAAQRGRLLDAMTRKYQAQDMERAADKEIAEARTIIQTLEFALRNESGSD